MERDEFLERIVLGDGSLSLSIDIWYSSCVKLPFKIRDSKQWVEVGGHDALKPNKLMIETHLTYGYLENLSRYEYELWTGLCRIMKGEEEKMGGGLNLSIKNSWYHGSLNEAIEKAKAHYQMALERVKSLQEGVVITENFLKDAIKDEISM